MPKVSINIIKEWFKNQSKPPQEQFWAWLDSFWHKDEPIPQSAVQNLVPTLQKKADLVNGVVPENQLPFSVVTSEVITLGSVELIDTKTYLRLHSSGANKVRVKGKLITRTFQNQWTITPIVADGVKVLRGYAVKNNDDFLLAEGAELPNYVEPEIPEDALEIFKITMRSNGNVIEQTETGLKYIAEDGWRNILLTEELTVLPYNFDLKSSYWINSRVANPVIGGIHNGVIDRNASPTWDGKEFWLFNNTGGDLLLDPSNVTAIDVYLFSDKLMPLTIKKSNAVLLKLKDNVIEIMQGGGGGASFPVSGNDGDVLVKSGTSALWSSIIKGVEFLGNAWLKLKLISFQGYTIAQKNAIASPTEGMLIYQNEVPKGFQKYENGAWSAVGNNISTADLTNVSARTFTQGNAFTWDSAGFIHYLKNGVKIDKITLPQFTTASPEANRLLNLNGRLRFSDANSSEQDLAYLSDLQGRLVKKYTHNANQEIYISAIDFATGYVTTTVAHGLSHSGQLLVGIFANGFAINSEPIYSSRVIPYEWITANIYVKVINATTLMICNSSGAVIAVNPSFSSNAQINISAFHIEILKAINFTDLALGIVKFKLVINGLGISGGINDLTKRFFVLVVKKRNNTDESYFMYLPNFLGNANKNNVTHSVTLDVDLSAYIPMMYGYEFSNGGSYEVSRYSNFLYPSMSGGPGTNIKGFLGLGNVDINSTLANGSTISIYI